MMLDEIEFFVCSTLVQHLEHSNVHSFFIQKVKPTNRRPYTERYLDKEILLKKNFIMEGAFLKNFSTLRNV